jgi:hypothetical protein
MMPFAVCRAGPADNGEVKKLLPRPPPPPRPPPSELALKKDDWFPGKYFTRLASSLNQKMDDLGISSHATELAAHPSSSGGVSALFPNTTAAIARERESRRVMDPQEVARLELWWRRQLISEGGDFGGAPPPPSDARYAFESRCANRVGRKQGGSGWRSVLRRHVWGFTLGVCESLGGPLARAPPPPQADAPGLGGNVAHRTALRD